MRNAPRITYSASAIRQPFSENQPLRLSTATRSVAQIPSPARRDQPARACGRTLSRRRRLQSQYGRRPACSSLGGCWRSLSGRRRQPCSPPQNVDGRWFVRSASAERPGRPIAVPPRSSAATPQSRREPSIRRCARSSSKAGTPDSTIEAPAFGRREHSALGWRSQSNMERLWPQAAHRNVAAQVP
jgi:hypothetical protein